MVSFKDNIFFFVVEMRNMFNDGFIFLKMSVLGLVLNYFLMCEFIEYYR